MKKYARPPGQATGRFGSGRTGPQTTKPDNSAWATVGSSRTAETIVAASIVKIFIVTLLQDRDPGPGWGMAGLRVAISC